MLQRRHSRAFFVGALKILLRKFAVFIEHFAETEFNCLPLLRHYGKRNISRDVLPEVEDFCAARRGNNVYSGKSLVLGNGNIIRRSGRNVAFCFLGKAAVGRRAPRFDYLAVLVVGKADFAVVRPRPRLIRADDRFVSALIRDFKLGI